MPEAFKETFFNRTVVNDLAAALAQVYPAFDRETFLSRVFDGGWDGRSLMERMRHITAVLRETLPADYRAALDILKQAAPLIPQHGFVIVGFADFVAQYGLDDWDASIPALAYFTPFASSEFAVRPFIVRDPERMMAQMLEWAGSENQHVRRLASEGSRPRLPWGMALAAFKKDPAPVLPILERLKDDPEEYVRRSVSNNLNDIAKDNPQVVIDVLRRWQADATPEVQWIIRRALRSLVKAGHSEALALLGHDDGVRVAVKNVSITPRHVQLGGSLTFSFEVELLDDQPHDLVIDYVVYYVKANGSLAPKVFKLSQKAIQPGQTLALQKKVSFKPVTTRVYYPGEHALAVKVNGQEFEGGRFTLEC